MEHPTTEMISGVNLPAAQLQIAMGVPLHLIRDIRVLYGVEPNGTSMIDFDGTGGNSKQRVPVAKGHVIAARITAENPDSGFQPNSGTLTELVFRSTSDVWGYFSVTSEGARIHEFADSQFGHLFAYGATRESARKSMVLALKSLSIRGDFRTTVEYLSNLLEMPKFIKNDVTTAWLDDILKSSQLISPVSNADANDLYVVAIIAAVCKTFQDSETQLLEYRSSVKRGHHPSHLLLSTKFNYVFSIKTTQYEFQTFITSPETCIVSLGTNRNEGQGLVVISQKLSDSGYLIRVGNGMSYTAYMTHTKLSSSLVIDCKNHLISYGIDHGSIRTPSAGRLVKYCVNDGENVDIGTVVAEIEVMKMCMELKSDAAGIFQRTLALGSVLSGGDIIGKLQLSDDFQAIVYSKPSTPFPVFR